MTRYLAGKTQGCSKGARKWYRNHPDYVVHSKTAYRLSSTPVWPGQKPFDLAKEATHATK